MPEVQAKTDTLSLEMKALIVLFCAVFYVYAFELNQYLFAHLTFSQGVNWVFIPSGLRLLFVLVFWEAGAIGIVIGSVYVNYTFTPDTHLFNWMSGLLSGVSPLLAHAIATRLFGFDVSLSGFHAQQLLKVSVLFALISSVLHQGWYFFAGKTEHVISSVAVMGLGDWLGTVLVLTAVTYAFKVYRRLVQK
jgi:hypothetical protein